MSNSYFLYRITLPNGMAYIGVSQNPRQRFQSHSTHARTFLGAEIRRCGQNNVKFEVLVRGLRPYIYDLETAAIQKFQTRFPKGYNLSLGGFGGRDPLPSTRAKMSAKRKGVPKLPAHRTKIGAANLGKKKPQFSAEHREKIGAKSKLNYSKNAAKLIAASHTPEANAKRGKKSKLNYPTISSKLLATAHTPKANAIRAAKAKERYAHGNELSRYNASGANLGRPRPDVALRNRAQRKSS